MDILIYLLLIYLLIINLISIIVTAYDKHCAKMRKYRISERTLIVLSLIGGSVGLYLTMQLIRHKTKHIKFMLGIPLIIILQIILAVLVYYYAR